MDAIDRSEAIRKRLGLNPYQFSHRLGYSATAYYYALKRRRLSRWMAREISERYKIPMEELK